MALEAIVFPQDLITTYTCYSKEYTLCNNNEFDMNYDFSSNNDMFYDIISPNLETLIENVDQWEGFKVLEGPSSNVVTPTGVGVTTNDGTRETRKKRRRKSGKNKEEVEQQRMTHIAVERNRRKQMNEYLATIRSLMPTSYVQRGDQASIVGGAINYVKELEQLLQSMEVEKMNKTHQCNNHHHHHNNNNNHDENNQKPSSPIKGDDDDIDDNVVASSLESTQPIFANFFSFPQYSSRSNNNSVSSNSDVGEIEVTIVESHANVKILAKKQSKQLVKLVAGFQGLHLIVLHLNVTTIHDSILYSLSLKVEEGCQLNSVDDIAAAANHILTQIQDQNNALL